MAENLTITYNLRHTSEETSRLLMQARLYERSTLRLLEDAGIGAGMRVLDVGTGAGDVALLAAKLVGPTGSVVAVDRNLDLLTLGTKRAQEAGLSNVSFQQADLHGLPFGREFDALVGRLILCHMPDPAGTLRELVRYVRHGGIVVAQELNLEPPHGLKGESPRARLEYEQLIEAFTLAHICPTTGMRLFSIFQDAGLDAPFLTGFTSLGCRSDWPGFEVAANMYRTMVPLFEQYGITNSATLAVEGMAARLYEDVVTLKLPFIYSTFIGAWSVV